MKRTIMAGLFLISSITVAEPMPTENSTGMSTEMLTKYYDNVVNENDIPGIQYTVIDTSGVVYEYTGGYQNINKNIPVSIKTNFMLNSSTKVFTAAAILHLSEQGKLDINNSVSEYFPDHPYGVEVKVIHLLNQTSGIPNPLPLKWVHLEKDHAVFDEKTFFSDVLSNESELDFPSGEKYAYSNISYWLLGKIIENVSGMKYCEYLQKNIFYPLDISSDELSCQLPDEKHYAYGYQKKYSFLSLFMYFMGTSKYFDHVENGYFRFKKVYHNGASYGGLYGTGRGVAKFLVELISDNSRIFSKDTRDLFFSKQKNSNGKAISMTLGWRYGKLDGVEYFEKPGGGPGGHSNIRIYPSKKLATVYLINKTVVQESLITEFSNKLDKNLFVRIGNTVKNE